MQIDNRRIAKNTILLYIRQILVMLVGLYTSRVILQNLGVDDYGIYGVVGGIVGFMGFLNGVLATGSSRFLTYALGEGDADKTEKTFSTTLTLHVILGFIILAIGEAIGPWAIEHKLIIPPDRLEAAQWAFQFSLLTMAIGVSQVPYSAVIVAHEKMDLYAYMAIVDILLRLGIATSLFYWGGDKLIFFAALLLIQSVGIMMFYRFYCSFKFKEAVFKLHIEKSLFKQIASFSAWNFVYQFVYSLNAQGTTILMGAFFSPAIVAAKTISVKVNQMTTQFIGTFRQAMNPQIVKLYAAGEMEEFKKLTLQSGKFSFFIMWIMTLPVCLLAPQLLGYWLKEVPAQADFFCILIMVDSLFWLFDCSFNQGIIAAGDIKANAIYSSILNFLRFPIIYIIYKLGGEAVWAFYISIGFGTIIGCVLKPWLLIKQSQFMWSDFLSVYWQCFKIVIISVIVPFVVNQYMPQHSFIQFIVMGVISVLSAMITIYWGGLDKITRKKINTIIKQKVCRSIK